VHCTQHTDGQILLTRHLAKVSNTSCSVQCTQIVVLLCDAPCRQDQDTSTSPKYQVCHVDCVGASEGRITSHGGGCSADLVLATYHSLLRTDAAIDLAWPRAHAALMVWLVQHISLQNTNCKLMVSSLLCVVRMQAVKEFLDSYGTCNATSNSTTSNSTFAANPDGPCSEGCSANGQCIDGQCYCNTGGRTGTLRNQSLHGGPRWVRRTIMSARLCCGCGVALRMCACAQPMAFKHWHLRSLLLSHETSERA
jgi:hypothetical protein